MSALSPVTVASLVTLSTEAALVIEKKELSMTPVIGGFVLGILLIGLYGLHDRLGTYMAVLILVMASLVNGPVLLKVVQKGA